MTDNKDRQRKPVPEVRTIAELCDAAIRYMHAFNALASGLVSDPQVFADNILGGATAENALADDMTAALAPLTPEEYAEAERELGRSDARRALVRAAIAWHQRYSEGYDAESEDDRALRTVLRLELCKAVDAFLAAGGNEVTG